MSIANFAAQVQILFGAVTKTAAALDTMEGQLDKVVNDTAPRAFAVLAEMLKKLAEGQISMADFEQQFIRIQALNAQGGGFLGDLDKLLLEIRRLMGQGLPPDDGGAPSGPSGPGPSTSAGVGGNASGGLGSSSTGFPSGPTSGGGRGGAAGLSGQMGATYTTQAAPSSTQDLTRALRRRP